MSAVCLEKAVKNDEAHDGMKSLSALAHTVEESLLHSFLFYKTTFWELARTARGRFDCSGISANSATEWAMSFGMRVWDLTKRPASEDLRNANSARIAEWWPANRATLESIQWPEFQKAEVEIGWEFFHSRGTQEPDDQKRRRLNLDDETQTVTLDGKQYPVANPKSYFLFRAIADRNGQPITRAELRQQNRGLKGDKTIPTLLAALPSKLRKAVKSSPAGYNLCLPAK
jgi:hypothetical protein